MGLRTLDERLGPHLGVGALNSNSSCRLALPLPGLVVGGFLALVGVLSIDLVGGGGTDASSLSNTLLALLCCRGV